MVGFSYWTMPVFMQIMAFLCRLITKEILHSEVVKFIFNFLQLSTASRNIAIKLCGRLCK